MESKQLTLYLDTSVFGGYFDVEFQTATQKLFESIVEGKYKILFSSVTENELKRAPESVRNLLAGIPNECFRQVEVIDEVVSLADSYLQEKVVGKTSREDCLHIALATYYDADILVSWNFKHIVNVFRIRGYNAVNLKFGYSAIDIRSPNEIVTYEN